MNNYNTISRKVKLPQNLVFKNAWSTFVDGGKAKLVACDHCHCLTMPKNWIWSPDGKKGLVRKSLCDTCYFEYCEDLK